MSVGNLSSSSSFVTETNRLRVMHQLSTRPSGKVPSYLLGKVSTNSSSLEAMEKDIQPLEKTAVLYSLCQTSTKITGLFLKLLKNEIGTSLSKENLAKVLAIKDKLIHLTQRYNNIDPQLNCLKILRFRLTANISKLLKNKDLVHKRVHSHTSGLSFNSAHLSASDIIATQLKEEIATFLGVIEWIERWTIASQENLSLPTAEVQKIKHDIEFFLTLTSDLSSNKKGIREAIQSIQEDLEVLHGLLLAPHSLVPLAICALIDESNVVRPDSRAAQELEEILEDHFQFVCDMIEMEYTSRLKNIKQKGAVAQQCRKALGQFHEDFNQKYRPLWLNIHQSYQSIYRQIYTKSVASVEDHMRKCEQLYLQLQSDNSVEQLKKSYFDLLKILQDCPLLPPFNELRYRLINRYLLPFHTAFSASYHYSRQFLLKDLTKFREAHQQYVQLIPRQQREMQTSLYTPLDLIYLNIWESIKAMDEKTDWSSVQGPVVRALGCIYQMIVQSQQWYQLSFPCFSDERNKIHQLYEEGRNFLNQAQQALEQEPKLTTTVHPLLEKMKSLLGCLNLFVISPSAYPFLFNSLGSQVIRTDSYEHELSTRIINFLYQQLDELRREEARSLSSTEETFGQVWAKEGFKESDLEIASQQPVTRGDAILIDLDQVHGNYFQKNPSLNWKKQFLLSFFLTAWEKIPVATAANLSEICPKLDRLMTHFEARKNELSMIKFIEGNDSDPIDNFLDILDAFLSLPYKSLSRYVVQRSLEQEKAGPPQQTVSRPKRTAKRQFLKKPESLSQPSPATKQVQPVIQILHSFAQQTGVSLALPTQTVDAVALDHMRDFHSQIVYHLGTIEDLVVGDVRSLSIQQLQTLLTHQAYAIEQSVKLAALARLPEGNQRQTLTQRLKSSHQPSEFFSSFLPARPNTNSTQWEKTAQTAAAVDGFLVGPARYALNTHPWMELLADLVEYEERHSVQVSPIEALDKLVQDNLSALQTLLFDVALSMPAPKSPFVDSSSPMQCLEGVKKMGLLQLSSGSTGTSYSADTLFTSLHQLSRINSVPQLSRYETTANRVQRREGINANLYMIQVNLEQIEELLQETHPTAWCSSYSSTLLLRAAAVLEKSVQSLLFWLPISSSQNMELHYLLATRPGPNDRPVPLRYTHSIRDNALVCAKNLAESGETALATNLEHIGDQLGWLDPFIQQLYRYPFTSLENRSAEILRRFNALAHLRRSLHQGDSSIRKALQDELAADPENLLTAYDQLIQSHLTSQVIAPVHEMLRASQQALETLVDLSNRPQ